MRGGDPESVVWGLAFWLALYFPITLGYTFHMADLLTVIGIAILVVLLLAVLDRLNRILKKL
jgi:uncharacterized membrane protein